MLIFTKIKRYYARWQWKREWITWAKANMSEVPIELLNFKVSSFDMLDTRGMPFLKPRDWKDVDEILSAPRHVSKRI